MQEKLISYIDVSELIQTFIEKIIGAVPNVIAAIILLLVGVWVCRYIRRLVAKIMVKRNVDVTVQSFVNQLIRWVLYIMLLLAVVQKLGFPASSLLGALTASALAIGLALQGSLSNFAGGIMLLILKPFKIGDVIQTKGETGTVQRIGMFYTTLNKFGNERVMIPNGPLFADNIVNFYAEDTRRVKVLVGISYGSSMKVAKEILLKVASECPWSLPEPEHIVFVEELADSSVNISVRFWVNGRDYWEAYFYMIENIKLEFDKSGIEIPFPQRDFNIRQQLPL